MSEMLTGALFGAGAIIAAGLLYLMFWVVVFALVWPVDMFRQWQHYRLHGEYAFGVSMPPKWVQRRWPDA